MANDDTRPRRIRVERSRDKLTRLRTRVAQAAEANRDDPMPGIMAGVLDLMEDMLR